MDNSWDMFYSGQKHMSRYPGLIDATPKSKYNLTFTGTPAKKLRYKLMSGSKTAGVRIRIHYPSSQSRNILKDGKIIEFN